jgi:hypothetical protein
MSNAFRHRTTSLVRTASHFLLYVVNIMATDRNRRFHISDVLTLLRFNCFSARLTDHHHNLHATIKYVYYSTCVPFIPIFFFCATAPQWAWASSFTKILDHARRTTVGRTPQDKLSARRRDLYLTPHNTHNRQTSMPTVGFEPPISAGERPQTHALDRAYKIITTMEARGDASSRARTIEVHTIYRQTIK